MTRVLGLVPMIALALVAAYLPAFRSDGWSGFLLGVMAASAYCALVPR